MAFVPTAGESPAEWIGEVVSEAAVRDAGIFDPRAAQALWTKCSGRGGAQFSNADNMALTGLLSTQLLHQRFVREGSSFGVVPKLDTLVDRLPEQP